MPPKIRVCMIVKNGYVADARVRKEVRSLTAAGHAVTILALEDPDVPQRTDLDGATVHYISRDWLSRRRRPPASPGKTIVKPAGGAARGPRRPDRPWIGALHRPLADRDFRRRCRAALRRLPADVYHAHDLPVLAAAAYGARHHGALFVYDSHELYTEAHGLSWLERWNLRRAERRLAPRADQIITVSQSIADELSRRYRVTSPIVVRNCPPRMEPRGDRRLREATNLGTEVPLVLYLGGLTGNRGLPELVDAVASLPRVHLALLGGGPLLSSLQEQARRRNASDRIHFLPPVPYGELLPWASSADVGVVPYKPTNLNHVYASPNKLFEYLGAGLAVATSDLPELRRVVVEHDVGELFDPERPQDIARALRTLLEDPARLAKARRNARRAALRLNWEHESEKLLQVYHRLAPQTSTVRAGEAHGSLDSPALRHEAP